MIVYIVKSPGGVEGVWTTPEAALKARGQSGSRAQIIVRGTDLAEDTDEVKDARRKLRELWDLHRDRESVKKLKEYREALTVHTGPINEQATRALATLADDPAGTLRREGIKGTQSAADCPIQRYLTANTSRPPGTRWYVHKDAATLLHGRYQVLFIELPDAVEGFRLGFDLGGFNYLIDTEATK